MPGLQSRAHILQAQFLLCQQDDNVVHQVSGLVDNLVSVAGCGGEGQFDAFLADFLSNPLGSGL
tara:strand:- start:39598 stop:39789 length:192 start_codon:yes stop_codon:yes gene_type:complete